LILDSVLSALNLKDILFKYQIMEKITQNASVHDMVLVYTYKWYYSSHDRHDHNLPTAQM